MKAMNNTLSIIAYIVLADPTFAYVALLFIAAGVILMWLIVKSSNEYSVEEAEEDSEDFAGEIRDSKGPVTTWLWAAYAGLIIWAIAYLIQHSAEFPQI
jgi:ABC-type dipeptide/oligopeptide/nickel transport system permease component